MSHDRPSRARAAPASSDRPAAPAGEAAAPGFAVPPAYWRHYGIGVQARGASRTDDDAPAAAARGVGGSAGPLPHLDAIQRSFGRHDVTRVQAHADAAAVAGARDLGAEAFALGDHVAFGGPPSLHTAAHEAAHVVQQRAGVHLKGGVGEAGDRYEQHADAVADLVVQGRSSEAMLDKMAGGGHAAAGVQLKAKKPGERLEFTHDDKEYSGLVVRVREKALLDGNVVYEVEANMDGVVRSVVVKGGRVVEFEEPFIPDVEKQVNELLSTGVRKVTREDVEYLRTLSENTGAEEGDFIIDSLGIVIKNPILSTQQMKNKSEHEQKARGDFVANVVRDLCIISMTQSGQALLASLRSMALGKGHLVCIEFVDGRLTRANAGNMGNGGKWQKSGVPGEGAKAVVSYNPSNRGMPLSRGPDDKEYPIEVGKISTDREIMPPLQSGWGRAKNKPSDVSLFHELVHADDFLHGRLDDRQTPRGNSEKGVKISERHAVGLDEYRDEEFLGGGKLSIYSENTYRHERGCALRDFYDGPEELEGKTPIEEDVSREKLLENVRATNSEVIGKFDDKGPTRSNEDDGRSEKKKKKEKKKEKKEKPTLPMHDSGAVEQFIRALSMGDHETAFEILLGEKLLEQVSAWHLAELAGGLLSDGNRKGMDACRILFEVHGGDGKTLVAACTSLIGTLVRGKRFDALQFVLHEFVVPFLKKSSPLLVTLLCDVVPKAPDAFLELLGKLEVPVEVEDEKEPLPLGVVVAQIAKGERKSKK